MTAINIRIPGTSNIDSICTDVPRTLLQSPITPPSSSGSPPLLSWDETLQINFIKK
jgi:hypothetical protein